ncbi:MAG: Cyanophage, partial [Cyanobacteriota bacterium]
WPRDLPTRKLNGATVGEKARSYANGDGVRAGSPRNLIDFGNLRQTGSWQMQGKYQAAFTWSASYATAVHEGAWIWAWGRKPPYKGARAVYLPPRPWTRAVLGTENVAAIKPFPLQTRLKDVWTAYFKSGSS